MRLLGYSKRAFHSERHLRSEYDHLTGVSHFRYPSKARLLDGLSGLLLDLESHALLKGPATQRGAIDIPLSIEHHAAPRQSSIGSASELV